ncbi:uncharacterized protein LOC111641801 isoform X1 [Centruroides sculpturatus]|uniref:uncharacterized protein LOC111641801 isoform X1 n=1 Tax=Centruroides sculpturatus TaxID=218467 RepID=UPI000C6DB5F6|nr:uncharacterized protein LOC111641801 isoform X1 [Centruroides sculpturatus]
MYNYFLSIRVNISPRMFPIRNYLSLIISALFITAHGNTNSVYMPEEWDEQLSELLREILENLRNEMPYGISSIDVPVLDPLVIPKISVDVNDHIANLTLRIIPLNIVGLSKFNIETLRADLEEGHASFDLSLPEIKASGKCHIQGKFIKIFPIFGDGDYSIEVNNLKISGYAHLEFNSTANTNLRLDRLQLDIFFDGIRVKFDNLMGGGRWTKSLMKVLNGISRNLFLRFKPEILKELNGAILKLTNHELGKGTLKELIENIPLPNLLFL